MQIVESALWSVIAFSALFITSDTFILGQVQPPVMELSALGALVTALFYLMKVRIPQKDKDFQNVMAEKDKEFAKALTDLSDRHERWERVRHEDHQELSRAINDMQKNCTKVQTQLLNGRKKQSDQGDG